MTNRQRFAAVSTALAAAVMMIATGASVRGQSGYKAPRLPFGQPDLQGVWQVVNAAAWDLEDHHARIGAPAGQSVVEGGEIPYQPAARAQKQKNYENRATADPNAKCHGPGVPRLTYMPYPFQIVQSRDYVAIFYEYGHHQRFVYFGGQHPEDVPFWLGDSRGRWDGDTLVVDVRNFTDQTWFDASGNFHSGALHVVERYTRIGPDHIQYEATIEDPKVFARPWKISMPLYRRLEKNIQLLEYACYEDLTLEKFFPGLRR